MATLKLRRGSSFSSPQLGEPFYNTDKDTLQLGISGSSFVTFTKLDDINTGSLLLNGGISASGDITASNLRVENDIRLNGSIYLGDEEVDKIFISASLSGSLIPDTGSAFDLGTETETWRTIYVDTGSIGQIELGGITVLDNLTVDGTSSFQTVTELDGTLTEYSQSVENRLSFLETDTGSQEGRLDNLEIFSSSQETKNTTLENTTSSLEQATSSLENFTSSQEELNVTFATTGSNNFIGDQSVTGSLFVSGAIKFEIPDGQNANIVIGDEGVVKLVPGRVATTDATNSPLFDNWTREGGFFRFDTVFVSNRENSYYNEIGITTNFSRSFEGFDTIDGVSEERPGFYASSGSDSFNYYTWLKLQRGDEYTDGRVTFTTPIISSGSFTAPLQEGYYWVGDENGYNEQVPTSSFTDRIDSLESDSGSQDSRITDLESTGSNHENRINQLETDTGSQDSRLDNLELFSGSQESKNTTLETVTSSLDQRLDSFESVSASYARTDIENTFTERQFFADIEVAGTASFARIESTTGSAKIIGDAFIILNNDTPTERYAGIKVLDSGSVNTTASFQYDGQLQNWFYEYSDDGGATSDYGITLFGPEYNDIESPVYPKNNYILKGLGGHHISSSRITDDGIQVEIETSLNVVGDITGSSFSGDILSTNGVISGSSQVDYVGLSDIPSGIVSGSSQITITNTDGFTTFSSSLDTRFVSLEDFVNTTYETDSSSFDSRLNNTESTGSDHENRLDTLETSFSTSLDSRLDFLESTGSDHESRIFTNEGDILNLEISESLLDIRIEDLETFSSSLDTEFLNTGGDNVVSGSDQLTSSYDQRYALSSSFQDVSSSYSTLIGEFDVTSSLGDAAFYFVSSSISDANPEVIGTAGAVKDYIDEAISSQGNISEILGGDGLLGGGGSGSITIDLDTGSTHFTNGVVQSLPTGTVSGSDQILGTTGILSSSNEDFDTFSSSVDTRLDDLETFSSSLESDFVTETELANATGALETSDTEQQSRLSQLETETGSIEGEQSVQDGRLTNLELSSGSYDSRFTTLETVTSSIENRLGQLETETSSIDSEQNTQDSRLSQLETETGSITNEQSVQDGRLDNIELFTSSIDTTIKTKLDSDGVISGSDQLTGSLVDLSSDQTIGGTKTFNDIVVNGTGSFAVIESISGEAKIIGDAYIVLNNNTPAERYAGFKVQDSGSADTTASFEYDGQTNDFFYQYTDDGGVTDEFGIVLFGPEYNTKGSPTYLSNNTIPKGNGGHHLNDSNITDSGTLITLGSNTVINGTITATGTTLISGSSQVNADTITNFDTNVKTKLDLDGVHSGSDQIVQFSKVGIGTGSDSTYELKVAGDIGATGDIVAYISSDRRLKENITLISDPIQKINQISGYTFDWNEDKQHIYKGKDYGVVAQEIQEIFPELVHERESGYLGVKYDKLVSVLIEAVKELSNEVNELKSKLE